MKKKKLILIFFITLFFIPYSYSQNIAYANMEKIINTSEVGKKIILYFNEKNENLSKEIKKQEKELIEKEKSLIAQKNVLTQDEFSKRAESIKQEIQNFKKNRTEKIETLNYNKDKISKNFLSEINIVLKDYAEKNKIDIIISSNQMLIGKSSLDVTENILNDVNSKIKKFEIK